MSQMTDRELIEACAKFMGYVVDEITEPDHDNPSTVTFVYDPKAPKNLRDNEQPIFRFDPLANLTDSAALRHEGWISVFHWGEGVEASHWPKAECNERLSDHNNDRAKAEMYAVARCVAKLMEGK